MKKIIIYLFTGFTAFIAASQNIPRPNITGPMGLEINTWTGNLFFPRTDITLRGTGFPVYGSFYYNAASRTLNTGYGHGWNFYYNIFYTDSANTITIHHSDAKGDLFTLTNGIYKSPAGVFDVLTKVGNEVILASKEGTKHYFSNASTKKLTRITDANGNTLTLEYASGSLSKVRNNNGRALQLTWSSGNLISIQDSAMPAKKIAYRYDDNNDMVAMANALGDSIKFTYNNHALVRLVDEKNNPVVVEYASGNTVKSIHSCNGDISFAFVPRPPIAINQPANVTTDLPRRSFVTQSSAAGNQFTYYDFDTEGKLTAVTNANSKNSTFSYDANNNITAWRNEKGLLTTYTYDAKGNLLTETDPQGNTMVLTYEPQFNKIASVKDKKGQMTSFFYDAKGNIQTITRPGSITEQYTYYEDGSLHTYTDANNKLTTYEYNSNGDLTKTNYPIGSQQFEYSGSCCNLSKIIDGNGNSLSMTYDLKNQPKTIKDDLNNLLQYNYDAAGNMASETDANGITRNYGYDQLNRLNSVSLRSAGTWQYSYDGAGNLTDLADANFHINRYQYNTLNQLVKETDPLGRSTIYTYDANGNVLTKQFPNGNTIQYKYDELNRLIQKDYPGNSDKFSYDANGNLASAFNNNITYTFEYDNLNRLTKKNIVSWGKSISYTYDAAGNRKTMTDYDGAVTNYDYDNNNRLVTLTNAYSLTTTFEYDAGGRLTRQNNANNTYTIYTYDVAGRLASIQHKRNAGADISSFSYTFDNMGNRKTLTDKYGLNNYTYDSSYRLTHVQYAGGSTESFKIDGTGNRTQRVKNGTDTTHYSYNSADELQSAGVSSFVYDTNGNTIQQTDSVQKSFSYDGENRMVQAIVNAKTVQYLYDPFGNKIMRIDTNGVITKMIYDGDNLLAELSNSNSTVTKYTTSLGIDSWLCFHISGADYFFHKDGLNSVTEITDNSAQLVNEYRYDAYGNVILQAINVNNLILYTGRLLEKNIGLYNYRSRFYNSNTGRFLTQDVFRSENNDPLLHNKFIYVSNNSLNNYDPFGLSPVYFSYLSFPDLYYGLYKVLGGHAHESEHFSKKINCDQISTFLSEFQNSPATLFDDKKRYLNTKYGMVDLQHIYYSAHPLNYNSSQKSGNLLLGATGIGIGLGFLFELSQLGGYLSSAFQSEDFISNHIGAVAATKSIFNGHSFSQNVKTEITRIGGCGPDPTGGIDEPPGPSLPDLIKKIIIEIITPTDPNEIVGTSGYGDDKWVSHKDQLPYKIYFANDPENATAPAQRAIIYMPISDKLNPNSLRLGDFGFGNFNFSVPADLAVYSNRLDVKDSLGVFVDITAGLDIPNRRAFWIFESIDPATGLSTTLPATAGFLPVNDTVTHKGEGYVTFTIQPADNARTRDTSFAKASIVFDTEDTVNTNTWINVIDAVAPASKINPLPSTSSYAFNISWTAADDSLGSGIKNYDLYVSKNGGPFLLEQSAIDSTSHYFVGEPGTTYNFYTRATDNTGNKEADKPGGDEIVSVIVPASSICPGTSTIFTITKPGDDYSYQWQVDSTGTGFVNQAENAINIGVNTDTLLLNIPPTYYYGYKYRCIATKDGSPVYGNAFVLKFTSSWQGNVNNAWENAANWSCGNVPDQYTDVIVPGAIVNNPVINDNTACRSLLVSSGTTLTINSGKKLDIKGK